MIPEPIIHFEVGIKRFNSVMTNYIPFLYWKFFRFDNDEVTIELKAYEHILDILDLPFDIPEIIPFQPSEYHRVSELLISISPVRLSTKILSIEENKLSVLNDLPYCEDELPTHIPSLRISGCILDIDFIDIKVLLEWIDHDFPDIGYQSQNATLKLYKYLNKGLLAIYEKGKIFSENYTINDEIPSWIAFLMEYSDWNESSGNMFEILHPQELYDYIWWSHHNTPDHCNNIVNTLSERFPTDISRLRLTYDLNINSF